jgi:uncharacterized delta-60 repeat protein
MEAQMRALRTAVVTFVAGLGVLGGVTGAQAAAGGLDTSFGTGGIVTTSYNGPFPGDAALQPDGKIVVIAGFDNDPAATEAFGVLRYLANGAPDAGFGSGGRVSTSFTNFLNQPNDVALQADGKIVVAGEAQSADGTVSEFAIARFNANGTLDTTFGTGGKVTTNIVGAMPGGVSDPAQAVLIQADGKILAAGLSSACAKCAHLSALARYNANGSLDTTFGTGGTVAVTAISQVTALAEDAAGNIFAVNGASIAEFSAAGALQSQVTPSPITVASSRGGGSSVFSPDGKYLAISGGAGFSRHDSDAKVIRYLANGTADPGFTNPVFDFSDEDTVASDAVQALAVQPDGKVVAAGLRNANGATTSGVARLTSAGALDPAFGTGGTLITPLPAGGQASAVLIQPDGKILVIGQGFIAGGGVTLILARYLGQ